MSRVAWMLTATAQSRVSELSEAGVLLPVGSIPSCSRRIDAWRTMRAILRAETPIGYRRAHRMLTGSLVVSWFTGRAVVPCLPYVEC